MQHSIVQKIFSPLFLQVDFKTLTARTTFFLPNILKIKKYKLTIKLRFLLVRLWNVQVAHLKTKNICWQIFISIYSQHLPKIQKLKFPYFIDDNHKVWRCSVKLACNHFLTVWTRKHKKSLIQSNYAACWDSVWKYLLGIN